MIPLITLPAVFFSKTPQIIFVNIFHYFRIKQNVENNKYFLFRDKNPQNIEEFKLELGNVNYQVIKILTYPTEIYFNFM